MENQVILEYDDEQNILFTEDNWEIKTPQDVDEFFSKYRKFFHDLDKKVYMVSNINNLLVHTEIAEYYGKVARETVGEYLLGFARWGTNNWAKMTVRTTSLKARMSTNIYDTKEKAIQTIREIQKSSQ